MGVALSTVLQITTDDLLEAAQLEEGGHPDPRPRSETLLRKLALNEAAMAAVAVNFHDFKSIKLVGDLQYTLDLGSFCCCTFSYSSVRVAQCS